PGSNRGCAGDFQVRLRFVVGARCARRAGRLGRRGSGLPSLSHRGCAKPGADFLGKNVPMKKEPAWVVADRKRKGWRRLFGKTSRPRIRRKLNRKAKALAAANRRAWLTLSIALLIGAALFALLLSVPPQMLPEQLADAVRLQKTHAF